jgi:hypothetical protein
MQASAMSLSTRLYRGGQKEKGRNVKEEEQGGEKLMKK